MYKTNNNITNTFFLLFHVHTPHLSIYLSLTHSHIPPCCWFLYGARRVWYSLQKQACNTKCGIIYACTRCEFSLYALFVPTSFLLYFSLHFFFSFFLHNRCRHRFVCYSHREIIHIHFYTKHSAPHTIIPFMKGTPKKRRNYN